MYDTYVLEPDLDCLILSSTIWQQMDEFSTLSFNQRIHQTINIPFFGRGPKKGKNGVSMLPMIKK